MTLIKMLAILLSPSDLRRAGLSTLGRFSEQFSIAREALHTKAAGLSSGLPVVEAEEAAKLDGMLDLDENWRLVRECDGIKVHQRDEEDGKFVCIRAEGTLQAPANVVLELFRSTDEPLIRSFNPMYDRGHALEPLEGGNTKVSWACSKAVFPLKARDFVTKVRYVARPDDGILVISEGLGSHPKAPRGFVRARVVTGLQEITPLGATRCRFTTVSRVDPGGAMPAWLSNVIAKRDAPAYLLRLEKAAQLRARQVGEEHHVHLGEEEGVQPAWQQEARLVAH